MRNLNSWLNLQIAFRIICLFSQCIFSYECPFIVTIRSSTETHCKVKSYESEDDLKYLKDYFVGGSWSSPVLWAKKESRSDGDIFVKNCPNLTDSLCTGGFWLWICHLWEAPNRPSRYCLGKVGAFLSFLRPLLFIIIEHLTAIKSEPPTVQISSPVFLDLMENNKRYDQEGICSWRSLFLI